MQFTFKRDEEGHERIYVDEACVWQCDGDMRSNAGRGMSTINATIAKYVDDAIEHADEAGFWKFDAKTEPAEVNHGLDYLNNEVTVDVPVADNAVLSVTVGGDES